MDFGFDPLRAIREIYSGSMSGNPPVDRPRYPMDERTDPSPMDPQNTAIDPTSIPYEFRQANDMGTQQQQDPYTSQARQQLLQLINSMPQRKKPSKWRRTGAIIGGMGGEPGAAERILYAPYNREMGDFKSKFDALAKVADLEQSENVLKANEANRLRIDADRAADNARLMQALGVKTEQGNRGLDIKEDAQAVNERKVAVQEALLKGGSLFVDERTGNRFMKRNDGVIIDVPQDTLSAAAEEELKIQGRIRVVKAGGSIREAIANADREAANARNEADNRAAAERNREAIAGRVQVANIRAHDPAAKGMSETQKKQYIINRADEFLRANPQFTDWIKIQDGRVILAIPRGGFFGNGMSGEQSAAAYSQIRAAIDPDYTGPMGTIPGSGDSSISITAPPPSQTAPPTAAPQGSTGAAPNLNLATQGTQGTTGTGVQATGGLPAPTADAALMNQAIADIDAENAKRAREGNKKPQIQKTQKNIEAAIAQLKGAK